MIACVLGICVAGSIPLVQQPAAAIQPEILVDAQDLVGAESANPQWGYGGKNLAKIFDN